MTKLRPRCAGALLLLVATVAPMDGARQFRISTSGVRLDVLALDGRTPHVGLTRDQFEVRDNGVLQQVDSVVATDAAHVVMALDVSGSVQGEPLRRLLDAANALLARLTERDRLTLVGFSHHVRLLTPVDGLVRQDLLPVSGSTSLHDAVFASVLLAGDDPRPALMILLTDGFDSTSWLTETQVLNATRRADVVIYPVVSNYEALRASTAPRARGAKRSLDRLADETGGRVFPVSSRRPLEDALLETLDEFRHRYILTYTPRGVERRGWHRVDVVLRGVRGSVHTRRGYEVR